MTYTIYLDRLFLLNFSMNLLLLLPVKWILGLAAPRLRIVCAAALGAVGYCAALLFTPGPFRGIWYAAGCVVISAGMVRLCFSAKGGAYLKALYVLYALSMAAGGALALLRRICPPLFEKNAMAGILFGMAALSIGIRRVLLRVRRRREPLCEVRLTVAQEMFTLPGLFDTGNGLREPIGGKPVSVLDKEAAARIKPYVKPEQLRVIPFRTVGREQGILYGARIERMQIGTEEGNLVVEGAVIAFADRAFGAKGSFRILLHPDLRQRM